MLVEIWSDVVCPWCYLGKRRFEAALACFEHAGEVEVRWRSFELDPSASARRESGMAAHLAEKYRMPLEAAEERLRQMDELAAGEGLAYELAGTKGGNTFKAHQLIHLAYSLSRELGAATKEALLAAYFLELAPIGELSTLLEVAAGVGIDPDEAAAALTADRFGPAVRADEQAAAEVGCNGVPFFVFDRAFAVSGAQSPDTFAAALREAWERGHVGAPGPVAVTTPGDGAAACVDDACAL